METNVKTVISVQTTVKAPVEMVWKLWSTPEDIIKWNNASDDWHTLWAKNDLRPGGHFNYRMEAKDGSMGFDFGGMYSKVILCKRIEYIIGDGRKVKIVFSTEDGETKVVETFEAENTFSIEIQRGGWQSILDNFKKYTETVYQLQKTIS
jgi:uncharacterized protein YndB with AHSA1/START domain